jgi:SAM-dependent methyltransferase
MDTKGNLIENWESQYQPLQITYSEALDNPVDLVEHCAREFLLEDIRKYLPNYQTAKILECGCGGARNSLYLSLRGFQVTCSDFTPEALRLARANFSAFNATGTFLLDDLMHSQIPAESFDCVMSFGLLEHFEDLGPLVASLTRLVRPGGIQIHIVIPKKFSTMVFGNLVWFPFRFMVLAIRKRDFRDIIRRSYRDFPHFENSFSAQDYAKAFRNGGNQVLRCEPRGVLFPFINLPLKLGQLLVKNFREKLLYLTQITNRTGSSILHFLSPSFCLICRKEPIPDKPAGGRK